MKQCAACHKLFHKGGNVGPDLTPYQRGNLETLLTSVIDPSAEIREGFEYINFNDNGWPYSHGLRDRSRYADRHLARESWRGHSRGT
jgi:putative heme-binding domain-containing protein